MKFREEFQKTLLLIEIGEPVLNESISITEEQEKLFIKKREPELCKLADFRKSQRAKSSWRRNRYNYMTGIKNFHSSVKGKKFHRQLGNFISSHNFTDSILDDGIVSSVLASDESLDSFCTSRINFGYIDLSEAAEILKALSSLKTHILIESDYFKPLFEEYSFRCLLEDSSLAIQSMEKSILEKYDVKIPIYDIEFVMRAINNSHLPIVSEKLDLPIDYILDRYNAAKQSLESKGWNKDMDGYYVVTYSRMLRHL